MPSIKTRRIVVADMPELLPMVQGLADHHFDTPTVSLEALERDTLGLSPWATVIVAEAEQGLCGYVALLPMMQLQFGVRGLDMHHLYVKPAHRGQRIGRALIDASIAFAKSQDCRFLTVGTDPKNHVAQKIYLAAGFSRRAGAGPRFSMKW